MNRRTFVRRVAALAAAAFIPPLGPASPKLLACEQIAQGHGPIPPFIPVLNTATNTVNYLANPEWRDAEYEISVVFFEGGCGDPHCIKDPWPPRFHTPEDAQNYMTWISRK